MRRAWLTRSLGGRDRGSTAGWHAPERVGAVAELTVFLVVFGGCSGGFSAVYALAHAGWRQGAWVRRVVALRGQASASALLLALLLSGCAVGPDYSREPAPVPTTYKELKGWKLANPSDTADRGNWWAPYKDSRLDRLLRDVEISNQTVAAAAAAYEQSRAIVREAQAALFPTATAGYSVTRTRTGALAGTTGGSAVGSSLRTRYTTQYSAPIAGSWDLDVWGKVRRSIEADASAAQASAADLDNAKLSAQAQLATAYFNLLAADSLRDLLHRSAAQFRETYEITLNKYKAGYGPSATTGTTSADVALAQSQVLAIEAQELSVGVQRAQFEHAIAVLIGRPPAELTIGPRLLGSRIPNIPVAVPSALLERRPDVAAAERTMQQDNALIGVAEAAYFPDVSLSAMVQFIGPIPLPFSAARSIQQIGASAAQTLFNGGLTGAQVDAARATYWQSVANYRQSVLTAFQQVEDELAAIRIFTKQLAIDQQAVKNAREAVRVFTNQYRSGIVDLTTVVTAETNLLSQEETELAVRQNLFLASVSLIKALGGGWDTTLLPTQVQLMKGFSLLPKLESTPPAIESAPTDTTLRNPQNTPQETR
jgi:NodT family efflux transporter outer membrane factor (OMF) lipoprotein